MYWLKYYLSIYSSIHHLSYLMYLRKLRLNKKSRLITIILPSYCNVSTMMISLTNIINVIVYLLSMSVFHVHSADWISWRHNGQFGLRSTHYSRHFLWKLCLHFREGMRESMLTGFKTSVDTRKAYRALFASATYFPGLQLGLSHYCV